MDDVKQIPVELSKLDELLPNAERRWGFDGPRIAFTHVTDDSRDVVDGGIFVAVAGYETDGHLYLEKAVENGAAVLVVQSDHVSENTELIKPVENHPLILVENTRQAASVLASEFYGNPSSQLKIHGITGTKGKTTTTHILGGILEASGRKVAIMGTLGIEFNGERWKSALTTPGPVEFQKRLRFLVDKGATDIVCEVSAHAGALSRTSSARFETVTYMNLSRDHRDHFSEEEYLDAKLAIARDAVKVNPDVIGIGNARDQHTEEFLSPISENRKIRFAAFEESENHNEVQADVAVTIKSRSSTDLNLTVKTQYWNLDVELPLIGRFNAQNAAAAVAVAMANGIEPEIIAEGLSNARPVPGRLELVDEGQQFSVVVDYAHAPQPAHEALACLRDITKGNLICVLGAGGSRDRGKRPLMGEVLARDCDIAVVTSDNPRKEEPLDIINDIMVGVTRISDKRAEVIVEVDRARAIGIALEKAHPGDTVAVLGKGHEDYQIFKDETIHFDDREVARDWLNSHGHRK